MRAWQRKRIVVFSRLVVKLVVQIVNVFLLVFYAIAVCQTNLRGRNVATKAQLVYAWRVIKSMRLSKEEQLELYYEVKSMNVDAARYFLADLSRHYGTGDRDCVWEWLG